MVRRHCTIFHYSMPYIPYLTYVSAQQWWYRNFKKVVSEFSIKVYTSLIIIMDLSNRVVQVRSTLKPDVKEYPPFTPDDIWILFGDIVSPTGLILNHSDPRECYVIFPDSEHVQDILKLVEDLQLVGTHMHFTLDRPRKEIFSIVAKCCVKCHPVVPLCYIGRPHGSIFDMPISKPIANWDQISVWWYPQCTWGKYRIVFVTLHYNLACQSFTFLWSLCVYLK